MGLTQVSTNGVKNDAITAGKIPADGVGQSEIADDSIGHGEIKANAVVTEKIASSAITQEKIAEQVINEARLQISNNGTDGQFLSKQSGNTGGLTWAAPSGGIATEYDALWLGGDNAYTDSDRWGNSHIGQGSASRGTLARVTNLSPVGNGVSVSGGNNPGYITFPSAGMWKIDWNLQVKRDTAGNYDIKMRVFHSTDSGSNFSVQAPEAVLAMDTYSGGVLRTNFTFFLNVTDASTHRIFLALYNSLGYDFQVSKNTLVQFSKIA